MADFTMLSNTVSSLKSAGQLAKAILDLGVTMDTQVKIFDLQRVIMEAQSNALDAQTEQAALIQEVRDLKQQIMDMENWNDEKQRYQLTSPWVGGFVYALKEACKGTEPPHWICAKCYEDGKKSVLQHNGKLVILESRVRCNECRAEIPDQRRSAEIKYV